MSDIEQKNNSQENQLGTEEDDYDSDSDLDISNVPKPASSSKVKK